MPTSSPLIPFASSALDVTSPTAPSVPGDATQVPEAGTALCLSGGGYRAMLFHVGALWRLNELGVMKKLARISSVSGGSITNGVLGLAWNQLAFQGGVATRFGDLVVAPIRNLAAETIDVGAVVGGVLLPGTISDRIAAAYKHHLFSNATLQDLPDDTQGPRFVFNATNVQSGVLWRFMRPYMRDWRVGEIPHPTVSLATAVAASSAFPPFLSPVEIALNEADFTPGSGTDLQRPPFTTHAVLTDGGVYDNLGLETCWKRYQTILVSDAGGALEAEGDPNEDWARHTYRVLNLINNQVIALRKRQLIGSLVSKEREGTYWGVRTDIADYKLNGSLPAPHANTLALAATPTRLKALDPERQEKLINWGYAVCDAAMRKHVAGQIVVNAPAAFPYPAHPL